MPDARSIGMGCLLSLACGCGASTSAPAPGPARVGGVAPLRAPVCKRDDAWQFGSQRLVARMLDFAGVPAFVMDDPERRKVIVRSLVDERTLAELVVPAPSNVEILAHEVLDTPEGQTIVVTGHMSPKNDGDLSMTTGYWMIPIDREGRVGAPISMALPAGHSWELSVIAVGDYRVALLDVPQDPPEDVDAPSPPSENHLVILDRAGNVLRSRHEVGLDWIFPIGDRAFGATVLDGKTRTLRVFDLADLDWVGAAQIPDHAIQDAISLGDHAVLVGSTPATDSDGSLGPLALATLGADGALSAWKPIDTAGHDVALVRAASPGSALLLSLQSDGDGGDQMSIAALDADLAISAPAPRTPGPSGGLGTQIFVRNDSIHIAAWGRVDRFACTTP